MGAQKAVGEDVNYTNKTLLWHCASPERERERVEGRRRDVCYNFREERN